jgi:hypothetical protein
MTDDIVTRLRLHYHRQAKLNPPMKPFIRFNTWRGVAVMIGRHEFGVLWK